jgi:hypothetical protein
VAAVAQETIEVRIGLHDVRGLRWPKRPLTGDGPTETVAVPIPRLPWSRAAVDVPLGASAARKVEQVTRLRKIFGYGVAPLIAVLFVAADLILIIGATDTTPAGRRLVGYLGVAGVLLIALGLVPNVVARRLGAPYVSRGQLRMTAAAPDVVQDAVRLNPKASIEKL